MNIGGESVLDPASSPEKREKFQEGEAENWGEFEQRGQEGHSLLFRQSSAAPKL